MRWFPSALALLLLAPLVAEARQPDRVRTPAATAETPRLDTRPPSVLSIVAGNRGGLGGLGHRATLNGIPQATLQFLCPHGGVPQRGGRCRPAPGRGGWGADTEVAGWHRDLRPATMSQLECPAGTVMTQARFNPGVTRCLPADQAPRAEAQLRAAPGPVQPGAQAEPSLLVAE